MGRARAASGERVPGDRQPWSRVTFGGSTGGWESIAWQIFYPDSLNGTWTACPDPVDFHYFQLVNIYEDTNAFRPNSSWKTTDVRGWERTPDNQSIMNQMDASHSKPSTARADGRGTRWTSSWTCSARWATDGYPRLLYDKWTGTIDKGVIDYWRDHYDLNHILQRDWRTLGPKLQGKLHFYVGDEDSYYLEEAAFLMKDFLDIDHASLRRHLGYRSPAATLLHRYARDSRRDVLPPSAARNVGAVRPRHRQERISVGSIERRARSGANRRQRP